MRNMDWKNQQYLLEDKCWHRLLTVDTSDTVTALPVLSFFWLAKRSFSLGDEHRSTERDPGTGDLPRNDPLEAIGNNIDRALSVKDEVPPAWHSFIGWGVMAANGRWPFLSVVDLSPDARRHCNTSEGSSIILFNCWEQSCDRIAGSWLPRRAIQLELSGKSWILTGPVNIIGNDDPFSLLFLMVGFKFIEIFSVLFSSSDDLFLDKDKFWKTNIIRWMKKKKEAESGQVGAVCKAQNTKRGEGFSVFWKLWFLQKISTHNSYHKKPRMRYINFFWFFSRQFIGLPERGYHESFRKCFLEKLFSMNSCDFAM